jgi:hypothetical protein
MRLTGAAHVEAPAGIKIFLLGDSRTGNNSLHEYFKRSGLRSVHYYIREAGLTEPIHRHRAANWPKLRRFIDESGFQAFSDYPTRMFHAELRDAYQDAYFILAVRRELETWRKSMSVLLAGQDADMDLLKAYYLCYNEEIRCNFRELKLRFLEIVIDDDSADNARQISNFLGLPWQGPLLRLFTSADVRATKKGLLF